MNLFKVKVIELRNAAEVLLAKLLFTAISKTEEFSALEETLEGGWLTDARFQGDEGLASL